MIADAIQSAMADTWTKLVGFAHLSFLDPFWGWFALGLLVIACATAVAWFFGSLMPAIRAIAGVIVLLVTFGLYAYRRGENEARAHDKPKRRK